MAVHLAGSVRTARHRFRKRLERCRKKTSETAVHDLRVETRRLLALLDLLESLHVECSLKKLRKDFKKRLDAFDDLRDTQVQLRLLKPLWPEFPEAANFRALLRDREKDLVGKLSRKVKATKYSRLNRQLKLVEQHLERCAGNALRDSSGALAAAAARRVFARVAVLRRRVRRSAPSTLHRMRVAFKRFRYLNELLQPFLPHLNEERLDRMKQYQGAAGEIQDIEVLLARLAAMVEDRCLRVYEIKNLRRELLRRRHRAVDAFMTRIDHLNDFQPDSPKSATPNKTRKVCP
jgi:CHAD domain-containing protein